VPGIAAIHDAFTSDWLTVQSVSDLAAVAALWTEPDRGESEPIMLMREIQADVLVLDERLALPQSPAPSSKIGGELAGDRTQPDGAGRAIRIGPCPENDRLYLVVLGAHTLTDKRSP
jgi:hypothetical protein